MSDEEPSAIGYAVQGLMAAMDPEQHAQAVSMITEAKSDPDAFVAYMCIQMANMRANLDVIMSILSAQGVVAVTTDEPVEPN